MHETLDLARFVADLSYDEMPEEVKLQAMRLFYDFMGNSSYATKTPAGQIITDYAMASTKPGTCTILPFFQGRAEASFAALAMGQLGHGFELDDVYMGTCLHPSGPVCAAALAVAQERGVSGKALLEAVIAGYEVAIRVGLPLGSSHQDWGFHATASFTVFGAAAAAAKVMGLDAEHIAWAFGLCGSMGSGIKQFSKSVSPSMVESLHGGKAAQQGVECAMLAERGFSGPVDVLEGSVGFVKVFRGTKDAEDIDYSKIVEDLGDRYYSMDISIKPNPNCATTLTACQCIEDFKKDPAFRAEDVESVHLKTHHNILQAHMDYTPNSVSAAQYSTPFSMALNIMYDISDPSPFLNDKLNEDPDILAFAQKVTAELDDEIEALFPEHYGNKLQITMKDGRVYEGMYVDYAGSAENPFTYQQIVDKFCGLVELTYDERTAAALEDAMERIPQMTNINELFAGLR